MHTDDFDYVLPTERIAQEPAEPRDASRLLILDRESGELSHRCFHELTELLEPGDVLVFNESRVIKARLRGIRSTGGNVEALLLRPVEEDGKVWEALVRPARRIRVGSRLQFFHGDKDTESNNSQVTVTATLREHLGEGRAWLELDWPNGNNWLETLEKVGEMPLPPYIHARSAPSERYQTVYARNPGSSAAPTAGLHFTPGLLEALQRKGIVTSFLTLHVGLGTFRPVQVEQIEQHEMHREYYEVPSETVESILQAKADGTRVIAVGTTVVRALESVAKDMLTEPIYKNKLYRGWSDIFIYPGYRFQLIDALITNFHLPRSTLLMLVCALAGRERVLDAYQEAIELNYRFYSFGDAMFIV